MATVTLPRRPIAPAWTRRFLQPRLESLGFAQEEVYELLVATCEAVSNAVLHGGPKDPFHPDEITITVAVEDSTLTIAVTSPKTGWPVSPPTLPDPTAEGGRGLYVIQCFTDSWSVTQDRNCTTVHLNRHLPESPPRAPRETAERTPPPGPPARPAGRH